MTSEPLVREAWRRHLTRWELAACLTIVMGASVLALLGWVAPDVDAWYGVGLVRAIGERPLAPVSLGHVPKLGHLVLVAPGVLFGGEPEQWLLVLGAAAFLVLIASQWRLALAVRVDAGRTLVALALAPIAWRGTLDATSVAWGWSAVLIALAARARGGTGIWWLAVASMFRPEAAGVGVALALWELRVTRSYRRALWLATTPAAVSVAAILAVDLIWCGTPGASATAHAAFVASRADQGGGVFTLVDSAHPLAMLSPALLMVAIAGVAWRGMRARRRNAGRADATDVGGVGAGSRVMWTVLVAMAGWLSVTAVNLAVDGGLFARFLLPVASALAVVAGAVPLPKRRVLAGALVAVYLAGAGWSWRWAAPEFVATYPASEAVLAGRRAAAVTPASATVAVDAAIRAVSLGSGVRSWRTTPWLLQSTDVPCESDVIVARGALLRRLGETLARCGPWVELPVADAARQDVHVITRQSAR